MFSKDDLGKGTLHPLFWVIGPLVLGALLVTGLGIAIRATQGFPDIELADDLGRRAATEDPLLADATDFAWDRVCVFPPYLPKEAVDDGLGLRWGVVGGWEISGDRDLLVFVDGDRVVKHFYLQRGLVDPARPEGDCRTPKDESTRL